MLFYSKVPSETDPKLVQFLIRAAEATLGNYLPQEYLLQYSADFFELSLKQLAASKTQDERIVWARYAQIGPASGKKKEYRQY